MKNPKIQMILEYFNKSILLWNDIFKCPSNIVFF